MFDLRLYVILDTGIAGSRSLLTIAKAAIAGGATMIQLRDKRMNYELGIRNYGKALHQITKNAGIPLIINDYVDVALAIGAEGVHLGQDDILIRNKELGIRNYGGKNHNSLFIIRNSLGPKKIIGVSVKTVTQAKRAQKNGADYVGVGPIFGTKSKPDAGKPIGLARLTSIVKSVSIPVVAIGGINEKNAKEVMETGASGIAVISAVMEAKDPERAARNMREIVDNRIWRMEGSGRK